MRHRGSIIVFAALVAAAAWLLFADRQGSRSATRDDSRPAAPLPRLAPGPALNLAGHAPFAVRLAGTIRNAAMKPIAGARVCPVCADCLLGPSGNSLRCAATDVEGTYAIENLAVGDYRLSAGADGYQPAMVHGGRVLRVPSEGLRADGLDGVLEEGGAKVTGVVLDGTGGPVAQATVEAHFIPDEPVKRFNVPHTTVSGEDGAFAIWVPRGGVRLMSRADGYAPGDTYVTAPATDVRLVMTPTSGVSGHVVTLADGRPVANVRVNAERRGIEQFAVSDDQGAFHITGLRPGTFNLTASGKGWIGQLSGSVTIDIGEEARDVLVHVEPGTTVRGVVQVDGDKPCPIGKVVLVPAGDSSLPRVSTLTDVEGNAVFEAVRPGRYASAAVCDGYDQVAGPTLDVPATGIEGVVWRFEPGYTVAVVARTTAGTPAERSWIDLRPPTPRSAPAQEPVKSGWTDEKGEVRFQGVKAGEYVVAGVDLAKPVPVTVRAGENRFAVTIDARGYIEVHATTAEGKPHDDLGLIARRVDTIAAPGLGNRYDTGRYRIGPLPEGEYEVAARDGANPSVKVRAQVRDAETTTVSLSYGGHRGSIRGRVIDTSGEPVADVAVGAEAADIASDDFAKNLEHEVRAQHRRVYTDALGRFEIPDLDARGTFTVVAVRRLGGEQRSQPASVGQHVEVVLPATGAIAGVVVGENGAPARIFRLRVHNRSTNQTLMPSFGADAQGRFRVEDVTAGEVEVLAASWDGQQASAVVSVGPGQELAGITLQLALQPDPGAAPHHASATANP
jgi:protocatechuate 3,4-dioxygenase beta subunit